MKPLNPILHSILEHRYFLNMEIDLLFEEKNEWNDIWSWVKDYVHSVKEGGAELADIAKETGEAISLDPKQFSKQFFKDYLSDPQTYHSASAIAGTVQGGGIGEVASLIDAALYAAEGDPEQAKWALLATIPFFGSVADAKRAKGAVEELEKTTVQLAKQRGSDIGYIPSPKTGDYLKTSNIPGSRTIEVPPRYDPIRPPTMPRPKPGEPSVPLPAPVEPTPIVPSPVEPIPAPVIPTEPIMPPTPYIPKPKPFVPPVLPKPISPPTPEENPSEEPEKEIKALEEPLSSTGVEPLETEPNLSNIIKMLAIPTLQSFLQKFDGTKKSTATDTEEPKEEEEEDQDIPIPSPPRIKPKTSFDVDVDAFGRKTKVDLEPAKMLGKYASSYRIT